LERPCQADQSTLRDLFSDQPFLSPMLTFYESIYINSQKYVPFMAVFLICCPAFEYHRDGEN
jgi:hypothetical protein